MLRRFLRSGEVKPCQLGRPGRGDSEVVDPAGYRALAKGSEPYEQQCRSLVQCGRLLPSPYRLLEVEIAA